MTDRPAEPGARPVRRPRRWRVFGALVLIAALVFVGWREVRRRSAAAAAAAAAAAPDTTQTGMRSVTLWFGSADGDSLVAETRELAEQPVLHARIAALVAALDQGPTRRGVAVLPAGTSVLHVYLDERGQLTLDLSRAFQQGFRGGSTAEDLAVGAIVRTIGDNVPEVRRILFTCGGAPLVTLGGHIPLDRPIGVDADGD
ncbi:MAG: GerMN domain-containing protein [Candidatus Eisenbacteria bacterium]|nr:GerMN domain-containing protein [Candidatus Eisenbacteria bacterium]